MRDVVINQWPYFVVEVGTWLTNYTRQLYVDVITYAYLKPEAYWVNKCVKYSWIVAIEAFKKPPI